MPNETADEAGLELQAGALSRQEQDTFAEMTHIAMGAAGAALSALLGEDMDPSAPDITQAPNAAALAEPFAGEPKALITLRYTQGLDTAIALLMREADVRALADRMLGAAPDAAEETPAAGLSELQIGTATELMNQMFNASATSLSAALQAPVGIESPQVSACDTDTWPASLEGQGADFSPENPVVAAHITLQGATGTAIAFFQLMPAQAVKRQVEALMAVSPTDAQSASGSDDPPTEGVSLVSRPDAPLGNANFSPDAAIDPVTVRPVEFASFDSQTSVRSNEENKNLALVMDVALNLTVELGKTELSIKDVLELTRGSVIELDRVAGEPVDLMANGKLIAKGEVVVIEDNFGLRITSIVSPADRLRGL